MCDDLYGSWSIRWLESHCYDGKSICGQTAGGCIDLHVHYFVDMKENEEKMFYVGFDQHGTNRKFFCIYDAEKFEITVKMRQTNINVQKCLKKLKRRLEVKF
jgi:predicted aldo/keto reductase-like oxidoreductase